MLATLHGVRALDFLSSDGGAIKGTQLFISYPTEGVLGEQTDKLFLRDGFALPAVKPGDTLDIAFNRKGNAEAIKLAAKQP